MKQLGSYALREIDRIIRDHGRTIESSATSLIYHGAMLPPSRDTGDDDLRLDVADGAPVRPSTTRLPEQPPPGVTTVFGYFCERFPRIPADVWHQRFDAGKVWCDRGALQSDSSFEPLLEVHYRREVDREPPVRRDVREVYRDHELLVVDKPPFLSVTPGGGWVRGCLLHLLGDHDLAPLHRLDRLTSGLIVLSRRPATRGWWTEMFVPGAAVVKTYTAVCEVSGREVPQQLVLEHHLARDPLAYWRERVVGDLPANASCGIELLDRAGRLALYRVEPVTGRKHQIRVQLAAAGLPILGDPLYGTDPRHDPGDLTRRMWLDAHRLVVEGFPRPEGEGQLSVTWESSRPPSELFARAFTQLGS